MEAVFRTFGGLQEKKAGLPELPEDARPLFPAVPGCGTLPERLAQKELPHQFGEGFPVKIEYPLVFVQAKASGGGRGVENFGKIGWGVGSGGQS